MSKKFNFEFTPFTFEELKGMSSDDLRLNMIKFKRMIREARNKGMTTQSFEVELCYLDNEQQLRNKFDISRNSNRRFGVR